MAYANKATITIDNTKVIGEANHTDIPILVAGTYAGAGSDPDLRVAGSGGDVQHASGWDMAFFSDVDLTTPLNFERVAWDGATGKVKFWVEVATLTYDSDTVIYLGYNDTVEEDPQTVNATWNANFDAVYHFEGNSNDSTANGYNGTDTNVDYSTSYGKTGGQGVNYSDSTADYITLNVALINLPAAGTILCWLYPTAAGSSGAQLYERPAIIAKDNIYQGFFREADGTLKAYHYDTTYRYVDTTGAIEEDEWGHAALSWDATDERIYINGAKDVTDTNYSWTDVNAASDGDVVSIGADNGGTLYYIDGYMDEMWIMNAKMTDEWIQTIYNSQNSPSTFYAISTGEAPAATNIRFGSLSLMGMGR